MAIVTCPVRAPDQSGRGMESDEILVARCLAGDERAFETLVERYEAPLRRLAFGFLRDRQLAEDVSQETFLQAYQKLSTLGRGGAFRSWLYRIAVNRVHDELRRLTRQGEVSGEETERSLEKTPAPGSLQGLVESRELGRQLAAAIARLDGKHRTPLILKEVQGMTYAEIAQLLGWPMGTVQIRIHRARLRLREQLKEQGLWKDERQ
jgi:RNA polymerase sigma-70 factor (ECF subfamily)